MMDSTHHPSLTSWVRSANGHSSFPIQNLPLCVFSPKGERPRGGIAIGDSIVDVLALLETEVLTGPAEAAAVAASGPNLNPLMALQPRSRKALREQISRLLDANGEQRSRIEPIAKRFLAKTEDCVLHLPAKVGDYTDFYAGIHHAENVGKQFRPDNPLLPNYKYVPIGYHGRSSSIVVSGTTVRRPSGQAKPPESSEPLFGPSKRLDYELELGLWIGPGNALGESISIDKAEEHLFGLCLLNDWSARDIQAWEYQPLGPFLAKSFATSISPWIITADALAPFRERQQPRPSNDPKPLPYLFSAADQFGGALNIQLEVLICSKMMREKHLPHHQLSLCNAGDLYWTPAQLIAHHTSGGCNLRPGDLLGTGTISSPDSKNVGSLLELTRGGRTPIELPSGETRTFLEDDDEVVIRGFCARPGAATIGLGEVSGRVVG